jgi:hypothetical protein
MGTLGSPGMTLLSQPFLKTTRAWAGTDLQEFARHGYTCITYQVQNDTGVVDHDLLPAKQAGLRAEVWGVTYAKENFYRDGELLGRQAVKLGCEQAVTMNCEMSAKGTRANREMQPIIEGVRSGGWMGAVNLNTYGAPVNPDVNDFEMDIQSFLETGGGVACQAYYNAFPEYRPDLCASYWRRMGVPEGFLSLTLGLYDPSTDNPGKTQLSGAEYVPWVQEAGVGKAISIFLPETMLPNDLVELEAITLASEPPEPPEPEDEMEKIGNQHGITAAMNRLRDLDPGGTALIRGEEGWPDISTLPPDLNKHKAWDKLQRTLQILKDDHDAAGQG